MIFLCKTHAFAKARLPEKKKQHIERFSENNATQGDKCTFLNLFTGQYGLRDVALFLGI